MLPLLLGAGTLTYRREWISVVSSGGVVETNTASTTSAREPGTGVPIQQSLRNLDELRRTLASWIARSDVLGNGAEITDLRLPKGSGVANETLLLDARWIEGGRTHDGGFVLRINTPEPLFPGSSARLQSRVGQALADIPGVRVPRVRAYEGDSSLLGQPFFLMDRIEGRVPPDEPIYHHSGWVTEVNAAQRRLMWEDAVLVFATLSNVDAKRFPFLHNSGVSDGLRANLDYYIREFDSTPGDRHTVIDSARVWLLKHYPGPGTLEFSWGDARVGNMIFSAGKVVAVLDWDMVSLAGSEADMAWWILMESAYTKSAGIQRLSGIGSPRELMSLWEQHTGRKLRNMDWHFVFASYRSAVIVRRLARMLRASGRLPPTSEFLENNNLGVQYLTTLLKLPGWENVAAPWPGLDI
jgi:aminoglycoside phosphotransferase (APT) family kinase protein